jgi:hypothetical protein
MEQSSNGHTDTNQQRADALNKSFPFSGSQPVNNEDYSATSMADQLVANHIMSRFNWMAQMLLPGRDIYKECGYPPCGEAIPAQLYRDMYDRDALSARVVQVLPKESWQVQPAIYEDEDPEVETAFETAWQELHRTLRGNSLYQDEQCSPIWDYLLRADILSGIGHYGVLLLGIDDGQPLDHPLEAFRGFDSQQPGTEGLHGPEPLRGDAQGYDTFTTKQLDEQGVPSFATPVPFNVKSATKDSTEESVGGKGTSKLIYLKVFDETLAQITRYERDPHNPRFGLPQMYLLTFNDPRNDPSGGAGLPVASAHCHWSRIIHIADNTGSNDVLGYPRMKQVFNRLWDAFKTYGASGEGFWQMAFAMLSLETNPALGADFKIDQDALREQLQKLRSGFQRHLVTAGMTAKTLPPALSDPTPYINIFIEAICIFLGCPVRVFKGSERGELASTQDDSSWNDRLRHRQIFYLTPKILVPFIDRLITAGVLPKPKGYSVVWPDLEALSDKDRATIALQSTQALAAYIAGQCENAMTLLDFYVNIMKIPHELAVQIVDSAQAAQDAEEQQTIEAEPTIEEQQAQTDASVPTHEKEAALTDAGDTQNTELAFNNWAKWNAEHRGNGISGTAIQLGEVAKVKNTKKSHMEAAEAHDKASSQFHKSGDEKLARMHHLEKWRHIDHVNKMDSMPKKDKIKGGVVHVTAERAISHTLHVGNVEVPNGELSKMVKLPLEEHKFGGASIGEHGNGHNHLNSMKTRATSKGVRDALIEQGWQHTHTHNLPSAAGGKNHQEGFVKGGHVLTTVDVGYGDTTLRVSKKPAGVQNYDTTHEKVLAEQDGDTQE